MCSTRNKILVLILLAAIVLIGVLVYLKNESNKARDLVYSLQKPIEQLEMENRLRQVTKPEKTLKELLYDTKFDDLEDDEKIKSYASEHFSLRFDSPVTLIAERQGYNETTPIESVYRDFSFELGLIENVSAKLGLTFLPIDAPFCKMYLRNEEYKEKIRKITWYHLDHGEMMDKFSSMYFIEWPNTCFQVSFNYSIIDLEMDKVGDKIVETKEFFKPIEESIMQSWRFAFDKEY